MDQEKKSTERLGIELPETGAASAATRDAATSWLCQACGRTGQTRQSVGDESCYMNAIEVYSDSIRHDAEGKLTAEAVNSTQRRFNLRRFNLADDTSFGRSFQHLLDVARAEGFETLLDEPVVGGDYADRMAILWKAVEGLLMYAESYYGGSSTNKAYVYFNLHTSAFPRDGTGGFEDDSTFVGFLDCREGLRRKLAETRKRGAFMPRWRHAQSLYLLNYAESRVARGCDVDVVKSGRLGKLPSRVRQAIALPATSQVK